MATTAAIERRKLQNGVTVLLSRNSRLPLVSLGAVVVAGSDQNPAGKSGLAALTCRLLDEGTESYDAKGISEIVEGSGGILFNFSQRELTGVFLSLGTSHLDWGFKLLGELIRRPTFPDERFQSEKTKHLSQLESLEDDPQQVGSDLLDSLIYAGTALEEPAQGTLTSISALGVEDVREFHRLRFAPENTMVVVVGDFSPDRAVELVEENFGDWSNDSFGRLYLEPFRRQEGPKFLVREMEREQVHVFVGHLGIDRSHPDYHVVQALDVILGSGPGFTSRIPRIVRDELGLAYSAYSDLCSSCGLYPGRFVSYVSTSPRQVARAKEALLGELEKVRLEGVTKEELLTAQEFLTGSFVFDLQSNADWARFVIQSELYGLPPNYREVYCDLIRSISLDEVRRVAGEQLDTVNYSLVEVGPLDSGELASADPTSEDTSWDD